MTDEIRVWALCGVMLFVAIALLRLNNRVAEVWQWFCARNADERMNEHALRAMRSRDDEVRKLHAACRRKNKRIAEKTGHHKFALAALAHNIERVKLLEAEVRKVCEERDTAQVERDMAKRLPVAKESTP